MAFWEWLGQHWFTLLQSGGIIGGLLFTAVSLRIDATVRRVGNLIAITHEHRDIWKQIYERPELWRVLDPDVDLKKAPVTYEEHLFVNLLILHLASVYEAMKHGMFVHLPALQKDIRSFFSRPIPQSVWLAMRPLQDREFIDLIEGYLTGDQ